MASHETRSLGRDMVALAGGFAAGVLGSRLLPPVFAGAAGSVRARLGEDPFERLKRDHRSILACLDRMVQATDDSVARRGTLFLSLKRTLGKHALAEEDVVYPVLHAESDAATAAKRLYSEHAEMKVHLYELEMALRGRAAWGTRVGTLQELVARHIRDEETVEFPRLQMLMDERRSQTLSGQIRREEAMLL